MQFVATDIAPPNDQNRIREWLGVKRKRDLLIFCKSCNIAARPILTNSILIDLLLANREWCERMAAMTELSSFQAHGR